jgi:outer membrane receptor protein involved in Fe transport
MKTMKNWLLTGLMFLIVSTAFAQGKVSGTVTDGKGSLPGANIVIKGTKIAVSTDFDGKFSINTTANSGELVVTFIGYQAKTVKFNGAANLGTIVLTADDNQLQEIVVKSGVVDIAKDRKTPVAVSTIKAAEIQEKLGTQEFPEILKNTPSVYVTKGGGGFGDSRINIRGFDQKNVAVMINGVPVNDMENSSVYWSNWAGLSDVTSAMQVQRGLGSSKLAISSVGGTINVVTKTSDMKEGGSVSTGFGNANYLKTQASYNTGLMKNGLSASFLLSSTTGDGYVDGTKFEGKNYFIALGYKPNDKHDFQFTFTGAPQWHNQRSTYITIATYQKYGTMDQPNTKYNSDWGYLNGEQFNMKRNFYHKPVASLNWDWKINETTKLSTVLYGSWGRGGGSTAAGGITGLTYTNDAFRTAAGLVDYDKIFAYNSGQTVLINGVAKTRTQVSGQFQNTSSSGSSTTSTAGISRISSFNSHDWYGGVVTLNKKIGKTLSFDFGLDARTYKGIHYQDLNSLLGGTAFIDKTNVNAPSTGRVLTETYSVSPSLNPFASSSVNEKIGYDYDGGVNWVGAFTQLEYSKDNLTAFVQGAVSQQGFKKTDRFTYLEANPLSETSFKNILGGDIKAGLNYNINDQHNIFGNAGYYSKQPFFSAVYPNNKSYVNGNLVNEEVVGAEIGYGFRSGIFNANLNGYYTSWKNRFVTGTETDQVANPGGYYTFSGVNEVHTGVELDMTARLLDKLKLIGMVSVGNWNYNGQAVSNRYDYQNNPVAGGTATTLFLDGVKVGDAAQTTASLGASYEVLPRVIVDANYNYNNKLYAAISPANFSSATNKGSLELPSYGLVDAGFSYKLLVGKDKANSVNFRLNVNNVMDKTYIAEAKTNIFATDNISSTNPSLGTYATNFGKTYNGVATANQVYFGFGRTWNFSLRYNF